MNFFPLAKTRNKGVVIYVKEELKPKEIWKDTEGRMLAIEICVDQRKVLLVGLYAPKGAKEPLFFLKLQQKLIENQYDQMM